MIDDQIGAPTGADLLADVTAHAIRAVQREPQLGGTYHAVAAGETSWHGYARFVIEWARAQGLPVKVAADAIEPVPTSAYPTPGTAAAATRAWTPTSCDAAFGLTLPRLADRRRTHARRGDAHRTDTT